MARILFALSVLALAACQSGQPQQTGSASAEPLDPFVVSIDAQRWGVIIDKALEGVHQAPAASDQVYEDQIYRADVALKSGAANLVELRNEVCGKGLLKGEACKLPDFPAWTREPPSAATTVRQIDERSRWLSEAADPFTSAGCEAGRKATGEDLFCSVE